MTTIYSKLGTIVWIYLILFGQAAYSDSSVANIICESPWQLLHRSCVQFMKDTPFLSWQSARDDCIAMNADLLSINNNQEHNNLKPLLAEHINDISLIQWWVGLRIANDTWTWVDNEEKYERIPRFAPGEGNIVDSSGNGLTESQCAVIEYQGYLNDELCTTTKPYICEQINLTSTTAATTTTTTTTTTLSTPLSTTLPTALPTDTPHTGNSTPISYTTGISTEGSTDKPTGKPTGKPTDKPTGKPTDKPHTGRPTDKQTGKPTDNPPTGQPTNKPTGKPTDIPEPDKDEFVGCYAMNLESTCPPVEAFGISWPRTDAGKMAIVPCDKGHARWKCDKQPTCWRDEPDVKQCTSEGIQELTSQMEDFMANTSNSEKAIAFTDNLATSAGSGTVMSEQDIYQSTKLMNAASMAKPKNSSEARNILTNVAKCGSNLVASDKKNAWLNMSQRSMRTVASSLLNSMATVTMEMLKSFSEPTVENIEQENMAIELQVIDITALEPQTKHVTFERESTSFGIPPANLQRSNTDDLAWLAFITYKNVGKLLVPEDDISDDDTERQLISEVVSASVGGQSSGEPLVKPVTFTMQTEQRTKYQEWKQLCSFWNFSLGFTGAWSQEGCSMKKYNSTHTTCQCNHLTNFAILMDIHNTKLSPIHATTLSYITYVGIIISIICLFLSWVTFMCLSSSQGERNSIHKNLVFCLFIAEVLFLAGIERTDNKIACALIAACLHYFFLASFTWMFVEGIHILFMLVQVFDAAKSRLRYYYLVGYGAPLLTVGISALVYYEGYGTEKYCWLTTDRMFIWSFAGPVAFILLVNFLILIYAMSAVCKHSEYVFAKEKSATGNMKAWIQGALALEVLLGLTWIFGYFYINEEAIPMAYLFTIFNSLQGVFIFMFHCLLNKKVRKEYTRFIDYPRRPVTSTTNSSSKGSHHNGTRQMSMSNRKHSGFMDLSKDRRPSSKSTTSA